MNTTAVIKAIRSVKWRDYRDASGDIANFEGLLQSIASGRDGAFEALADLEDRLLIPGVLCSAAPHSIRVALAMIPSVHDEIEDSLYLLLMFFHRHARSGNPEDYSWCSPWDPYPSYERLLEAIDEALNAGAALYKAAAEQPEARRPDKLRAACILLAEASRGKTELLPLFRDIVSAVRGTPLVSDALLSARKVGTGSPEWSEYLLHFAFDQESDEITSGLAAALLLDECGSECPEYVVQKFLSCRGRLGWPGTADIVKDLPAASRRRILSFMLAPGNGAIELADSYVAFQFLKTMFHDGLRLRSYGTGQGTRGEWGTIFEVSGGTSEFPEKLDPDQRLLLARIAESDALWRDYTNLWSIFALPDSRAELEELIARDRGPETGNPQAVSPAPPNLSDPGTKRRNFRGRH